MITSLQHVGLGVADAASSYAFYREFLGFGIKMADYNNYSQEMEPIIGELVKMRIIMALSSRGKGSVELVQHLSTPPRPADIQWGDIGFLASGYRVANLPATVSQLERMGAKFKVRSYVSKLASGLRWESAFLTDPDGNLVELIDTSGGNHKPTAFDGLAHVTIGVRDMDRSLPFYRDILGYKTVLLDITGEDPGLGPLFKGKPAQRQVILSRNQAFKSPFATSDGGTIRLVQALNYQGKDIFAGRRWGDFGQMECCFEVDDLRATIAEIQNKKVKVYHPPTHMDMGSGSVGSFAYIKDPDGILIEFLEVKKVLWLSPQMFSVVLRILCPVFVWLSR